MERFGKVILALLFLPIMLHAQWQIGQRSFGLHPPAAITWTVIQHPNDGVTCTTYSCTLTNVTTTAGDLLILTGIMASTTSSLYSSASGDGTWTHCPTSGAQANPSGFFLQSDCAYILSATGVTNGTFTMNWTNGGAQITAGISLIEVRRSVGTATYDIGDVRSDFGCTACVGPGVTTSGASDYILEFAAGSNSGGTPGSPWTNPFDIFVGGAANQVAASYTATWTFSTSSVAAMGMVSFK